MASSVVSAVLENIDAILSSLTILFPGFLAYFIYIGLRASDYNRLTRGHLILVLFSTLFFQIIKNLLGEALQSGVIAFAFFFILPLLLGVAADLGHRVFTTVVVAKYQDQIVDRYSSLGLVDVGNVSRWQKTVQSYVEDGLNDITKEYYIEVENLNPNGPDRVKRGFLNGYSDDDIELIRYDDLETKDFPGIGEPDINTGQLTMAVELIPRDKISSIRIYRIKMEDFALE